MNTEFCIIIGTTETKQNFILKYLLKWNGFKASLKFIIVWILQQQKQNNKNKNKHQEKCNKSREVTFFLCKTCLVMVVFKFYCLATDKLKQFFIILCMYNILCEYTCLFCFVHLLLRRCWQGR
jgi:hypothetical protein